MPKKRRSKDGDNIIPHKVTEHHKWECNVKGCNANGTAYTKEDAKLALRMHEALTH